MKFHVYDSSLSFLKEKKKGINETSLEIHPMIPSFSKKRILRTKRDDTILRKTTPSPSSNQTVLTFALRRPAASSPGTMHANYQPAIMIHPCRRRRRRRKKRSVRWKFVRV